ncbi:MAG TPA: MauE/DoxX family redox-associated membrane protein [Allosphingosinicella sp.]|nr:MauE/DoxX family redox-associated membrane protein [Allosphingosinicella sp.]
MTPAAAYLAELCRLYVAVALLAAAIGKAGDLASFRLTIAALLPVPMRRTGPAALAIVATEGLVALPLLAGGPWSRPAMAAAMTLLIAFTVVLFVALVQRKAISCNCFGGGGHMISAFDLLRNAALIAAAGFNLGYGPAGNVLDLAAGLLLLGIAAVLFLVSTSLDGIARLSR